MNWKVLRAKQQCDDMLIGTWNEIKDDLHSGKVRYDDLDRLVTYTFLKQFDDMFSYMEDVFAKKLSEIKCFYRAAAGKWNNYERFVPKEEFKSLNRFNPPEEMFIYLGVCDDNNPSEFDRLSAVEETCLKEIRAVEGSEVSLCEFKVREDSVDKKVIDISIADGKSFDKLNNEVADIRTRIDLSKKINFGLKGTLSKINRNDAEKCIEEKDGNFYELSKVLSKIYMKMVSEDLFKPVDGLDRDYEYAPFHSFVNYFRRKGYSGIIYNSTVNPGNKNIVLFDINDVVPIGEIKTIIYK